MRRNLFYSLAFTGCLIPGLWTARGASEDPENHVLTMVRFDQPSAPADYVNSAWKTQDNPYKGDVANCYNDGPPAPGKPQLGRFYEFESSSPARVSASHESVEHTERTIHLVGTEQQPDPIARELLGCSSYRCSFFQSLGVECK